MKKRIKELERQAESIFPIDYLEAMQNKGWEKTLYHRRRDYVRSQLGPIGKLIYWFHG